MRRIGIVALLVGIAVLVMAAPASARHAFPDTIPLPTGWQPEGIAVGHGKQVYVGSIPTGAVWRGDLRTGEGETLVPAQAGRSAIGIEVDRRGRLWVAGGATGQAYVYDAETGAELAAYTLTSATPTFVNDVVVTRDAAWFTDSNQAVLYRVPLGPDGALPDQAGVQTVALTGDFALAAGNNLNGIEATRDGRTIVAVQTNTGQLFRITPDGVTDRIELSGGDVANGDGLLLRGRTLYVVQNRLNQIAVVTLDGGLATGTIETALTDPRLDVPTTLATAGKRLYAVNARFGVADPAQAAYDVVALGRLDGRGGHDGHGGCHR